MGTSRDNDRNHIGKKWDDKNSKVDSSLDLQSQPTPGAAPRLAAAAARVALQPARRQSLPPPPDVDEAAAANATGSTRTLP